MDTKQITDLLSKVDIFKGLPPLLVPTIADQFRVDNFKAQEIVIKQNQKAQNFYIISRGRLDVYVKDQKSGQTHISYLLPRDYFGDICLLYDQPSTTEIKAVEDSECLYLPKEIFLELLQIDPEISQHILRSMLKQLRKTNIVEEAAKYKEKALQFLQQNKRTVQYTKIIGKSKAINELTSAIETIAQNNHPILIEGEYGTGKELIARIIHNKSTRSEKPFISVDCEKLVPETVHTQLFGDRSFYKPSQQEMGMGFSYIELAEGGSLLLKNIEVLSFDVQVRIQELLTAEEKSKIQDNLYSPDVRIMATSRVDLQTKQEIGQFDKKLLQSLSAQKLYLTPLRERKKDIPDIVHHFIKKYAGYYHKEVDKVSEGAIKVLLGHDYKLSNIQELEEVIERAVSLTRSDTVRSEHIFLGPPAGKPLVLFNLLDLDFFVSWVKRKLFPEKIREIVALAFLMIIGLSLFSHQLPYPYNNVGKLLTWSIWWPAMFISFFFIGRLWCSICPYATYSHLAKLIVNKERNFPWKKYDYLFMTLGFLFIIWVEEVSDMRHSSFKVGLLQLSIVSLAVTMGVIYKRDSWCRYICPLGGLISTCSMASIVELRSNPDVCLNHCTTHDCYKGTKDNPGCPMFQHLMYVDNNQTCKICLNCVRSCTHNNISLNIRPLATEIYNSNQLNKGLFLFVISLMGIIIPILLMQKHIISHNIIPFTLIYAVTPCILLFILWIITEMGYGNKEQSGSEILWRLTYAYVPLALAAHIAYQIQFLPVVHNFLFSVLLSPSIEANIVIYSKTLFSLFKIMYFFFEFIIFFKVITHIILAFKNIKLEGGSFVKPLVNSGIVSMALYFLPRINTYIFSLLHPAAESTTIVYSIPLFHVFQIMLLLVGMLFSFYCLFRIFKKYMASNLKRYRVLLTSHFIFIVFYTIIVSFLLIL